MAALSSSRLGSGSVAKGSVSVMALRVGRRCEGEFVGVRELLEVVDIDEVDDAVEVRVGCGPLGDCGGSAIVRGLTAQ